MKRATDAAVEDEDLPSDRVSVWRNSVMVIAKIVSMSKAYAFVIVRPDANAFVTLTGQTNPRSIPARSSIHAAAYLPHPPLANSHALISASPTFPVLTPATK